MKTNYINYWTIADNGYGVNYNVHVNSLDTNGTFKRYYWSDAQIFDSNSVNTIKTTDSIYSRRFGFSEINDIVPMWIYGRDDDGLISGGNFIVYADAPPPEPAATYSNFTQKISWSGKDVKDGNGTLYKILVKKGSAIDSTQENNATYIVQDFKAGSLYTSELNGKFSFTYTQTTGSGDYYYMVIAKDARGSISRSSRVAYFTY